MTWIKHHYKLIGVITTLIVINVSLLLIGPQSLVDSIGMKNVYIIVFTIASLGGMSSLTGATYINAIVVFAAGGANPWLIGLFGGLGIFISDSIFYLLATYGHKVVPLKWRPTLKRIMDKMSVLSKRKVLIFTYIYHILPLPSDLMMLALVLGGYSYKTVAPVILLAALTYSTLVAHFGSLWFY